MVESQRGSLFQWHHTLDADDHLPDDRPGKEVLHDGMLHRFDAYVIKYIDGGPTPPLLSSSKADD